MKKPESKLFERLAYGMRSYFIDMHRIENSMELGTPDMHYTSMNNEGWAELKYIKELPKRNDTTIKIPFRPGQYAWLRDRYNLNHQTYNWLILQIDDMLFMFLNESIKEEYTRKQLLAYAYCQYLMKDLDNKVIFQCLNGKFGLDK